MSGQRSPGANGSPGGSGTVMTTDRSVRLTRGVPGAPVVHAPKVTVIRTCRVSVVSLP